MVLDNTDEIYLFLMGAGQPTEFPLSMLPWVVYLTSAVHNTREKEMLFLKAVAHRTYSGPPGG
jgi:hypothetical protein